MNYVSDNSGRFRTPRGEKPQFHADPAIDDLLRMIVALSSEVSVLRERLDTHERLAAKTGAFSPDQVDSFEPDAKSQAARAVLRKDIVDRVFSSVLAQESSATDESHASIVAEIEGDSGIGGSAGL